MDTQDDNLISVKVSSDRLEATLTVMPGIDRNYVNSDVVLAKAVAQAIQTGSALTKRISEALIAFGDYDLVERGAFQYVIAKGQASEDGQDSQFTLETELAVIQQLSKKRALQAEKDTKADEDDEHLDHRERSVIMVVKAGQRLGQIKHATDGIDGTDVCGNTISAKPGVQASLQFDSQSIECHDNGAVIAKIAGQLLLEGDSAHINPTLVINEYVDYSTGNIDFPGKVEVFEGIRDCFEVVSGQSITVSGLVEAADLVAARDIELHGGISGRDKGTLHAGRDIHAHYLNAAVCKVGRDLIVEKEICDCTVVVTGSVRSPSSRIMGGHVSVLGTCECWQVGSEAGAHTILSLGRADALDGLVRDTLKLIGKLSAKAAKAKAQMQELNDNPEASSLKAEMMTSLKFEASEAESKKKPLMAALEGTYKLIEEKSEPTLTVQGLLCQGSEIRAGGHKAVFTQSIQGPLTIRLDEIGEMVCVDLKSGSVTPVKNMAKLSPDESSFSRQELPAGLRKAA